MRHHFVPQFLLRPWADETRDGKVEVFRLDIENIPSSRRSPKHTGYEDDLYALTKEVVAGMDKQAIENKFLRDVDNLAARVRDKLDMVGFDALSIEDRMDWARFLMSLRLRQPNIVLQLKREAADHLSETLAEQPDQYEALAGDTDAPTLEEWTEQNYPGLVENFGLSFFSELVDNANIGTKIMRMKWWIWNFTGTGRDLLLADNPCIFSAGIDDPKLTIALPISPTKAFIATNSERTATILREQEPKHLATRINESSLAQAQVRIYARNSSPGRFVRNRLRGGARGQVAPTK